MTARAQNPTGTWIPLMEYAIKRGISLSTLRRHIKAKKLEFKVEKGKYLLWDGEARALSPLDGGEAPRVEIQVHSELDHLQSALKKAQEEIAELKMLIALYEETIPPQESTR